MSRLVLIDGNSIMNRAFYGIMGNKMLMLPDGTYKLSFAKFMTEDELKEVAGGVEGYQKTNGPKFISPLLR